MTNRKISELPAIAGTDLTDNDIFPVVDNVGTATDTTKKATVGQLRAALAGGSSSPYAYEQHIPITAAGFSGQSNRIEALNMYTADTLTPQLAATGVRVGDPVIGDDDYIYNLVPATMSTSGITTGPFWTRFDGTMSVAAGATTGIAVWLRITHRFPNAPAGTPNRVSFRRVDIGIVFGAVGNKDLNGFNSDYRVTATTPQVGLADQIIEITMDLVFQATLHSDTNAPAVVGININDLLFYRPGVHFYQLAQKLGPKGDQGETGPQGDQGLRGIQGQTGATGQQGVQGNPGQTGATGPTGPQGNPGTNGTDGNDGTGVPSGGNPGQIIERTLTNYGWIDKVQTWENGPSPKNFFTGDIIKYRAGTSGPFEYYLVIVAIAQNSTFSNLASNAIRRIDNEATFKTWTSGQARPQMIPGDFLQFTTGTVVTYWLVTANITAQTTGDLTLSGVTSGFLTPLINPNQFADTTTTNLNTLIPVEQGKYTFALTGNVINAPSGASTPMFVETYSTGTQWQQTLFSREGSWTRQSETNPIESSWIAGGGGSSGTGTGVFQGVLIDVPDPRPLSDGAIFIAENTISGGTYFGVAYSGGFTIGKVYEKFGGTANPRWADAGLDTQQYFRGEWATPGGYRQFQSVTYQGDMYFAATNIGSNVVPTTVNSGWRKVPRNVALNAINTFAVNRQVFQGRSSLIGYLLVRGGTEPYTITAQSGVSVSGSGALRTVVYTAGDDESLGAATKSITIIDSANPTTSISVNFAVNVTSSFAQRVTWNVGDVETVGNATFDGADNVTEVFGAQATWNVGLASNVDFAEWDDDGTEATTTIAAWNGGSGGNVNTTGVATIGDVSGSFGGIASGRALYVNITAATGTRPTADSSTIHTLTFTPTGGSVLSITGALDVSTNILGSHTIIRVGSAANFQTTFSSVAVGAAGVWRLSQDSTPVSANNAFCYNADVLTGSVPVSPGVQQYRLTLAGNSGTFNNNSVTGTLTFGPTGCFVIGSVGEMRQAFGSGNDIASGGGTWTLETVTTTTTSTASGTLIYNGFASGSIPAGSDGKTFRLALSGNATYTDRSLVGILTTSTGPIALRVGSVAEMRTAFGEVDINSGGGTFTLSEQLEDLTSDDVIQTTVQVDATLKGTGAAESRLGVNDNGVGLVHLNATGKMGDRVLATNAAGDALEFVEQSAVPAVDDATIETFDNNGTTTLRVRGDGIGSDQIADDAVGSDQIAADAVGLDQLNITGTATAQFVVRLNAAGTGLEFAAGGGGVSAVDDVTLEVFDNNGTMQLRVKDLGITLAKLAQAVQDRIPPLPPSS